MDRKIVATDLAPAAIGPYSQGLIWGNILFCAGQIPLVPGKMRMVNGDIRTQVERVIENLKAVLEEGESSLDQVLRLDVFMTDLSRFNEVNEVLTEVFSNEPPARVTVEVSGLPMGAEIEIAAIAAIK
ncbi:MAG: Rid family detoxifying hydrolase [Pseudomonadota bacterium]|jgi:reactive intermediate/imine deaminase